MAGARAGYESSSAQWDIAALFSGLDLRKNRDGLKECSVISSLSDVKAAKSVFL